MRGGRYLGTLLAVAALGAVLIAGLVGAGVIGSSDRASPGLSGLPIAQTDPAVVLEGVTLAGGRLSVTELAGRPVFVTVWASW